MHTYPYTAISRFDILTNDTCNTCAKRGPCFFWELRHRIGADAALVRLRISSSLPFGTCSWKCFLSFFSEVLCRCGRGSNKQLQNSFVSILELRKETVCCILMQFCGKPSERLVGRCWLWTVNRMLRSPWGGSDHPIRCIAVHRCTRRLQIESRRSWVWSWFWRCMPLLYLTLLVSGLSLRKTFGCYKYDSNLT